MRMTLAVAACIASIAAAVPALAQGPGGCPPGLAMKGCVPPGQAKKMGIYAPAPPVVVYQPPVAYVPTYRDYPPAPSSLNLGVTVPLQ
jgi:hypothetical protein